MTGTPGYVHSGTGQARGTFLWALPGLQEMSDYDKRALEGGKLWSLVLQSGAAWRFQSGQVLSAQGGLER